MNNIQKPYDIKPFVDEIREENDWKTPKLELHRQDIASYLYNRNNGKCFYCKCYIGRSANVEHIEHVINKNAYPQFSYHPRNLTIACAKCNTPKSTHSVLRPEKENMAYKYDEYPYDENDYTIVHPYLDVYENHISIEDGIFYKPVDNSSKGLRTIEICHLDRIISVEDKMRKKLANKRFCTALIETTDYRETSLILEDIEIYLSGKDEIFLTDFESNKILCYFINDVCHDIALKGTNIVEKLCNVNVVHVKIINCFKLLKSLFETYDNNYLDKRKLIKILKENSKLKNYLITYYNTYWDELKNLIETMHILIKKENYRERFRFLKNIKFEEICSKYIELEINTNKSIQLTILFHMKNFMEICCLYDLDKYDNLETEVKVDLILIKKLKEILDSGI